MPSTRYTILRAVDYDDDGPLWAVRGEVEAASADAALRQAGERLAQADDTELKLAAVPARSWAPVSLARVERPQFKIDRKPAPELTAPAPDGAAA